MRYLLLVGVLALFATSCTINKDIMFKTDKDFVFDVLDSSASDSSYRIAPNDILTFSLFSNNGARLIEFQAIGSNQLVTQGRGTAIVDYYVKEDGNVDLPEIGDVKVGGMTIVEAQDSLEVLYSALYNFPYAILRVMNNRVIVYPGGGGDAQVVPLTNNNTSVIEAMALAGGLSPRGNASKIKLFRYDRVEEDYDIYHMDLSTIEGINFATTPVQANDVIYVEPVPDIAREVFQDIQPLINIVSGVALIIAVARAQI